MGRYAKSIKCKSPGTSIVNSEKFFLNSVTVLFFDTAVVFIASTFLSGYR